MYIKLSQDTTEFPYSLAKLKETHYNVSFPNDITEAILAEYQVYPVTYASVPTYDARTNNCISKTYPTLIDNTWVLEYDVIEKTAQEIEDYENTLIQEYKYIRDKKLSETDWIVIKYTDLGETIPIEWKEYRQALRDIPAQLNFPNSVIWPTKPGVL